METFLSERTTGKLLRRFERSFAPYRKELSRQYGEEFAARIGEGTREEYAGLLPRTPRFAGAFNIFNTVIRINAMIVALHRSMKREGRRAEETAKVLFTVAVAAHRGTPRWIARTVIFSRLFLRFARQSAALVRDHPKGWTIDYHAGDGRECDWFFECSRCGAVDYMREHGAEDLARYCNYVDFIQSREFGLGMRNPENIGQGGPRCREEFKRGRETEVPANLSSIVEAVPPEA